jgi:hypothetical protein
MSFYRTHTLTCTPSYTLTCTPSHTLTCTPSCFTRIISNILSLILVFFLMPACHTHDVASFFGRRTNAFSSGRHMPLGAHTPLLLRATHAHRCTNTYSGATRPPTHERLLLRATYAHRCTNTFSLNEPLTPPHE